MVLKKYVKSRIELGLRVRQLLENRGIASVALLTDLKRLAWL
jgi:hypothetical protein